MKTSFYIYACVAGFIVSTSTNAASIEYTYINKEAKAGVYVGGYTPYTCDLDYSQDTSFSATGVSASSTACSPRVADASLYDIGLDGTGFYLSGTASSSALGTSAYSNTSTQSYSRFRTKFTVAETTNLNIFTDWFAHEIGNGGTTLALELKACSLCPNLLSDITNPSVSIGTAGTSVELLPGEYSFYLNYSSSAGGETSTQSAGSISGTYFLSVSTVPVPAAAWLFGSGLLALVGVARRKKAA